MIEADVDGICGRDDDNDNEHLVHDCTRGKSIDADASERGRRPS